MLTQYIQRAMHRATYTMYDDGTFYGEIPELQGVWGSGATLEACREDLQGALETRIVVGLRRDHPFPALDGEDLSIKPEVVEELDDVAAVEDAA